MRDWRATYSLLLILAVIAVAGCASTLHPERVNQPKENRGDIDLPLAIGDLAVPGGTLLLIHDFRTGAIYKPKVPPATTTSDVSTTPAP